MLEHDLGRVLSTGQELTHRFRLTNPLDRPIRLVNPLAYTPCCSAIGPLPESIHPGGVAEVPVVFRTRGQQGKGRLIFSIEAADPERIGWQLMLTSDLLPSWEVVPEDDAPIRLPVGRPGSARFRLVRRVQGEGGPMAPDHVEGLGGLSASFDGPIVEDSGSDGLTTIEQMVKVTLPASPEAGTRGGTIRFRQPDGSARDHPVRWSVFPLVTIRPGAIILPGTSPGDGPVRRTIEVRAEDRPIRVLGVTGPLAEDPRLPPDARPEHRLELAVDPARLGGRVVDDLVIRTDHPDQPEVVLTVFRQQHGARTE